VFIGITFWQPVPRKEIVQMLRKIAAILPIHVQQELKRYYFWGQIKLGRFKSEEPEYEILEAYLKPGGWAIDVGANVGHYSARLSHLVGPKGRVIAFEPIPETFELLASNVSRLPIKNITLINSAVSDCTSCIGMEIPSFDTGLKNFYQAHISVSGNFGMSVMSVAIDSICIPEPINLIKIDAEGHEYQVIQGARRTISSSRPVLIVEGNDQAVEVLLSNIGYRFRQLPKSPNRIFVPTQSATGNIA
jgi:FkbM family methyltransferase